MYGLSEAACWIKLSENSTCDVTTLIWHFCSCFIMDLSFVSAYQLWSHFSPYSWWCARELWDRSKVLVNHLFIDRVLRRYCHWSSTSLCTFYCGQHCICGAIPNIRNANFKLQRLVYSIIIYILQLFIPFICLLYLSIVCCRKECNKEQPLKTTTSFVSFTDQEDEPLIIKQGTKI